jgi:hypothetical protein
VISKQSRHISECRDPTPEFHPSENLPSTFQTITAISPLYRHFADPPEIQKEFRNDRLFLKMRIVLTLIFSPPSQSFWEFCWGVFSGKKQSTAIFENFFMVRKDR